MKIDLISGSYQQKYQDISSERTINWSFSSFNQNEQAKNSKALYPTPGLSLYCTISGRYYRKGIVANTTKYSRAFIVIDNTLWEVNTNFTVTNRGTLTNIPIGSSRLWMFVNGNQEVYIGSFNAGYVFNMDTNTLTQITDTNYPTTVVSAAYSDGYLFVVSGAGTTNPNPGFVIFCVANSFLNWTGTSGQQAFHPTFKASGSIAVAAFKDKMYIFSKETIEPYYEDGSTAIWSRYPASIIKTGATIANTISVFDQGIIFVGKSDNGQAQVYLLSDQSAPQSLSNLSPSIQWALNSKREALNGTYSYIQINKEGQTLYYLTCPELQTTFVFNLLSGQWTERQSTQPFSNVDGAQNQDIFRGADYLNFNGYNLFPDVYSGNLYYEDYSNYTENNTYIKRTRISSTYNVDYKNISVNSFEVDVTKGVGVLTSIPTLMFEKSINGGRTYRQPTNILLSAQGDYLYRSRTTKLGAGRNWVLKLTITDPADIMIQQAYANGEVGQY